jgi:hypothetical protein
MDIFCDKGHRIFWLAGDCQLVMKFGLLCSWSAVASDIPLLDLVSTGCYVRHKVTLWLKMLLLLLLLVPHGLTQNSVWIICDARSLCFSCSWYSQKTQSVSFIIALFWGLAPTSQRTLTHDDQSWREIINTRMCSNNNFIEDIPLCL